ncbi:MAG TPA: hypothetical protein VMH83_02615, partial [Candidatus Acidoferrum sp.]|nr:hypothetical protein [Candidatus Acidoferrum sp.]
MSELMRKWRRWRQLSHWERRVVLTLAWQLPRYRLLLRLVPLERLLLPAATSARAALPPRWTSAAFARRCEQLAAIVVANAS